MPDLSAFGTPADQAQAPPTPPSGGGGPDLSSFGTPASAAQPQTTFDRFKAWAKSEPTESTGSDVLDAIRDFGQGTASSFSEVPATLGGLVDKAIGHDDPLTAAFKKQVGLKPDTLAGKAGGLFENVAEWMVGEEALKGLSMSERMTKLTPVVKMLEKYPKIAEAAAAHPEIARYLPDAVRQAALGTAQTAAHGGTAQESLESGAFAGSLGMALPVVGGAAKNVLANIAEKVQPVVRDIEGAKFTQLASEAKGPEGQPLAPKVAQKAAQYSSEPALQAERQAAFKDLQTNLAKKGIRNALIDSNMDMTESGVGHEVQQSAGGGWRYYPPDGSTSLSESEARSALNELKQKWLDQDWGPRQDARIRQAYDDLKDQLDRKQRYDVSQPVGTPHDVAGVTAGVNSYGDAADHLSTTAQQKLQLMDADTRQQYQSLAQQRDAAQEAFDQARYNPDDRAAAFNQVNDLNQQLEGIFEGSAKTGSSAPEMMQSALKEQKLSNAFRQLQNTMDRHFNLHADTAEAINRPRTATNLGSLSDDIEKIKSRYGDVLNPVLGDQGLNHITELGDLLKTTGGAKPAAKTYLENVAMVLRKHLSGMRGILSGSAGGAGSLMLYHAGHLLGGGAGAVGALGGEAAYRMVVNRMATDPAFAERIMYAAKNNVSPRIAGPLIASMMTAQRGEQQDQRQEQANAPGTQ